MYVKKTAEELVFMEEGGKILGQILTALEKRIAPRVSTLELEEEARRLMKEFGATPAFLGYTPHGARRAYPAALCVSVNEEVVHGIPNEHPKVLQEGDVVSIDTGICYKGLFTDSARTIPVGKIDKTSRLLIKATKEALLESIKMARVGNKTGDLGFAIAEVAKKYNFSPAEDLGGHGVGKTPHEDPFLPNFSAKGQGVILEEGMTLAIEPMLCEGSGKVKMLTDGYTFVTRDKKRSAHFEHTVLVTKGEPKILTK